jgi:hypothetical protein
LFHQVVEERGPGVVSTQAPGPGFDRERAGGEIIIINNYSMDPQPGFDEARTGGKMMIR